jgi:hypothetical protein
MPLQEITYSKELEKLLKNQAEQAESYSILHNLSYEKYQFRSNIINIPVIVLSSVIGLLTGMNIQNDDMFIILSTGSIFVSVIKSIDSYFQLQKRAEGHRICSLQFSQIFNKIQIELSLSRDQRQNPKDMLALIKTDLKNLFDIAPLIDADIIQKYNGLYKNETGVSKPPITNGLTHIVVQDTEHPAKTSTNPYETQKVKEKMKNARELGIAYDPDIDALGSDDDAKQDKNVIMRVKPLGEKEFTEIRKDDPIVVEIIEEM